jgi:hypothetical protein
MENKKIFIACPITKYLDSNLLIDSDYEAFIKAIYSTCRSYSTEVFLALEREKYGKALMEGPECTFYDYQEMVSSDIVVALPEDSLGVAVELGWASAMKKEIFLILDKSFSYSPLVQSLHVVSSAQLIWVKSRTADPKTVTEMIVKNLKEFLDERFSFLNRPKQSVALTR